MFLEVMLKNDNQLLFIFQLLIYKSTLTLIESQIIRIT